MSDNKVVPWVPPQMRDPAALAELAAKAEAALVRKAENSTRLAIAKTKKAHAEMALVGIEFVLSQLKKWLVMSQDPEFAKTVGPIEPAIVLKLAEFISKNFRLDNGQATERVAHAVQTSINFSKMTQEERDTWKQLAEKYRDAPEGEVVDESGGDT